MTNYFREQWEERPDGAFPESYRLFYGLLESRGNTCPKVLDFGCGNGAFIRFLRNQGIETIGVDPIPVENDMRRHIHTSLLELPEGRFDAITAFEVFEHLDRPCDTLSHLVTLLDEDAFIFITTAVTNRALTNIRCFEHWIYQKDPTHIGFFHERTFEWIALRFNLEAHLFRYCCVVLDRSFERLIDVENGRFVFRRDGQSHLVYRPGPF
jgi:SAM-dependent methyltransferase